MEVERTGFSGFTTVPDKSNEKPADGEAATTVSSSSPPTASPEPAPPQQASNDTPTTSGSPPASTSPESSKNKDLPEEFATQAPPAPAERMTEMPEGEEGWRAYYEHPLTAATTAMLNINGGGAEDQSSGMGLLYEYYKLPSLDKLDKAMVDKYTTALPEIWSTAVTSSVANTLVPGAPLRVLPAAAAAISSTPTKVVSVASSSPPTTLVTTSAGRTSQPVSPEPPAVIQQQDVELFLNRAALAAKGEPAAAELLAANGGSPTGAATVNGAKSAEGGGLSSPDRSRPGSAKSTLSGGLPATNGASDIPVIVSSPSASVVVHVKQEPLETSTTPVDLQTDALHHLRDSPHATVDISLPSPVPPVSTATPVSLPEALKAREMQGSPPQSATTVISLGPASPYPTQLFANLTAVQPTYDGVGLSQYGVVTSPGPVVNNSGQSPQYGVIGGTQTTSSSRSTASNVYTLSTSDYYREYYSSPATPTDQYQTVRQHLATYSDTESAAFLDRYIRQNNNYKGTTAAANLHGLTVDLPSPDSGIGEATITPRENGGLPQIFDYSELSQTQTILQSTEQKGNGPATPSSRSSSSQSNRRSWHDYGRNSDSDKVQIPKIHSDVGFKYFLESPISTSQRKEDDRITYINKGQFYGITLEYVPDPDKPLKHTTVKSIVMLVFREEKSMEDEMKAWQFWHSRQHSVKQRILDADTKNSSGIVGQIEESTHNAISFYWNPLESPAKINIAVQCLSTDFSNQKGVKGLPLHLQIDTFDDGREGCSPVHRGYCQIKVFCDKGAERKTRDEERRAAKRKLTATGTTTTPAATANNIPLETMGGRKKIEEMYHPPCERSEFYSMSDLTKLPILFTPSEDLDKLTSVELNFYNNHSPQIQGEEPMLPERQEPKAVDPSANTDLTFTQPPAKRAKVYPTDRVMLYARRENEEVYQALHLVPPTLAGLANAIETKYNISTKQIRNLFKRSKKGITVQMDDDIIKHYCNEDLFIVEIIKLEDGCYDITLVEL